jgi:ectoine hydroxylase-related dioxygenase (phytanoyl-CoA dioxygenase family)
MLTYRNNLVGIDPITRELIAVAEEDESVLLARLEVDGFSFVRGMLSADEVAELREALDSEAERVDAEAARSRRGAVFARRNLLDSPAVRTLLASGPLQRVVRRVLGLEARAVRGILFDKTPEANWLVPWHQDLSIAVRQRRDVPGFGPWSVKAGVHHVQPPVEILQRMLTVRLHLDACHDENGPLRVIPGSHRALLRHVELDLQVREQPAVVCCADAGDALLMRPMLAHTSAPAQSPSRRRVVHLEFAPCGLPGGLQWHAELPT